MAKRRRPPSKTRRLTRTEAARLGVSYSAKRRVDASLKRITRRTRIYTDREVAQAKLGKTKEAATKERTGTHKRKTGETIRFYNNLTKQQLFKILRKHRDQPVVLRFHAHRSGRKYQDEGVIWTSGPEVDADTLLDPAGFREYLDENDIIGKPDMYGVTIL